MNTQVLASKSASEESVGGSLRMGISHQLPGEDAAVALRSTLQELLLCVSHTIYSETRQEDKIMTPRRKTSLFKIFYCVAEILSEK